MKKLIVAAALLMASVSLSAQELSIKDNPEIPVHIIQDFDQEYPGVLRENWSVHDGVYEVDFIYADRDRTVRYHPDGTRLEDIEFIHRRDVPEQVGERIGTVLDAPFRIKSARQVDHEYFGSYYEVEVRSDRQDMRLMIREDGSFLQEPSMVYEE